MSNPGSIFISYRRSDSKNFSRKLYDKIAPRFENGMVFRDLDIIGGGIPWKGLIEEQLANCRVFIAVIGPTWLEATQNGQRRLDNPDDWVRREIEYAFINGIPIIPVLVNGTSTPKEAELPGPCLKRLPMLQGRRIRYDSDISQTHIELLIEDIRKHLEKPDPREIYTERIEGCWSLQMIRISKGTFWMGAHQDDIDAQSEEKPLHKVDVPEFWMGMFPVTQDQWYAVSLLPDIDIPLDPKPSSFSHRLVDPLPRYTYPVDNVNWYEAVEFCNRVTKYSSQKKEQYPDMKYRLPSEAEWEYACRAGTITRYYFGDNLREEEAHFKEKGFTASRTTGSCLFYQQEKWCEEL